MSTEFATAPPGRWFLATKILRLTTWFLGFAMLAAHAINPDHLITEYLTLAAFGALIVLVVVGLYCASFIAERIFAKHKKN